jgi:hypothetical protein
MKAKRVSVNISLGQKLKNDAREYAQGLEMDLSELVAHLLREELANPTIGQKKLDDDHAPVVATQRIGSTVRPKSRGKGAPEAVKTRSSLAR